MGDIFYPNFQTAACCFIAYDGVHEGKTVGRYRPFYLKPLFSATNSGHLVL